MVVTTNIPANSNKLKQDMLLNLSSEKAKDMSDATSIISNKLQNMTFSAHTIQGKRNHMEDYFDIAYQQRKCNHEAVFTDVKSHVDYFYFGIFDGHGGKWAAEFARNNLLENITKHKDFWSKDDTKVLKSIKDGFMATQKQMLKMLPSWPSHSNIIDGRPNKLPSTAGTTASILFIKNQKYYTGHVGDSRIVLARECSETKCWISKDLTNDHKPELPEEKKRIESAGGEVREKLGVHRVVWKKPILVPDAETDLDVSYRFPLPDEIVYKYISIPFLAIARSLGDFWSIHPDSEDFIVSPEPDVSCMPIHSNDKGLILASDGLWNVVYSELAVRILQQLDPSANQKDQSDIYKDIDNYYSTAPDGNYAKNLIDIAYQIWEWRNLKSDNITSIVIKFEDIIDSPMNDNENLIDEVCRTCLCKFMPHKPNSEIEYTPKHLKQNSVTYFETIHPGCMPKFDSKTSYDDEEQKFYSLYTPVARLPPSITNLEAPKNYQRLSDTCYRVMTYNRSDASPASSPDSYKAVKGDHPRTVLIAEATDDPQDLSKEPLRLNKFKKYVRNSSCQATQALQDFGQSWHEMMRRDISKSGRHITSIKLSTSASEKVTTALQVQQPVVATKTKPKFVRSKIKTRSKSRTRSLAQGAQKHAAHLLSTAITKVRRKKY